MTPAEINQAIAESMGWDWYAVEKAGWYYREGGHGYTNRIEEAGKYTKEQATALIIRGEPMSIVQIPPPNYHGDLNACAEFERALLGGNAKQNIHSTNRYTNELCKLLQCLDTALFQFATATAPQRCEAYLKTIGKWREQ
jgi:hypothetical protein